MICTAPWRTLLARRAWRTAAVLVAVSAAAPAHAQSGGDGFLFKPPKGTLTFRTGLDHANAGSDLFKFTTDQLTVDRGDFSSVLWAGDVSIRVSQRLDAVITVAYSGSQTQSEFRNWTDNKKLPIEQTTRFQRVPLTGSLKAYLTRPGRSIGHFAWMPARYAPYVGAGGGMMWYQFAQDGDIIDFATTRVFPDQFDSNGWTPTVHAYAGADISMNPRFSLTTEARYEWARAALGRDYAGFDKIDLSGFTLTTGISVRY